MQKYNVSGMSCAACSARVEKAVSKLEGVSSCSVNLLTNSMMVNGSTPDKIISAVQAAGYGASLADTKNLSKQPASKDSETRSLYVRLISSIVLLCFLMYLSMGCAMWNWPLPFGLAENFMAQAILQMLLAGIVMVINQRFFISGFSALLHLAPNMDTLVALGSMASFIYSTCVVLWATNGHAGVHLIHHLYFESAAMIVTLITVGKLLESRSKGKTTDALKSLMNLAPKTATVIVNEMETVVPIEQVKIGDIFVVRSGESIPTDAVILQGDCAVNESALTGESIPIDKTIGDKVSAGTLNQSGFIRCKAERVGEDTTLSQIIKMVSDAASSKAPIAKLADKVSGVFVPVVITIAVITTLVWLLLYKDIGTALSYGIAVLVISCPCALGLATPVAIMVGSGVGAKNGILFKTASSLELLGKVNIIALDKTGTITTGHPQVTDIIAVDGFSESELLYLSATLEYKSEHPLAKAVVLKATEYQIKPSEPDEFTVLTGNGVKAILDGKQLMGGNYAFISQFVSIGDEIFQKAEDFAEQGKTPLYFAYDSKLIGVIAVADILKEDSTSAVAKLKQMGISVVMLTGDHIKTARAIANTAGIEQMEAGLLPQQKEQTIRELSTQGRVAMVGDGINDAPALASADIGIAIGAGTEVAMDAADVVLMRSSLTDVVSALKLSRATLKNIKENLFWAFVYNIIGIPLAAGVFSSWLGWSLNPMFGAAAMSLSSFCVVSNALRLNLFKPIRKESMKMKKVFSVQGMMCPHCEAHVKNALEALGGVESAVADHKAGTVTVILTCELSDDVIKETIVSQGYTVL